jgi:hypothetical protein
MEALSAEYAAVNGSQTDKYSLPRNIRVTYYNAQNELVQLDLRSRALAERICAVKGATMVIRKES